MFSVLYAKVEASVRIIQDQLRDGKLNHYDKTLEVIKTLEADSYKGLCTKGFIRVQNVSVPVLFMGKEWRG